MTAGRLGLHRPLRPQTDGTRAAVVAVGCVLAVAGCMRESPRAEVPQSTAPPAVATRGADGTQQVTVAGNDRLRFVPDTIRARAGVLRITLRNVGGTPHNLAVAGGGPPSGYASGGAAVTVTVTLRQAGTYEFECQLHRKERMFGRLVVAP